MHRLIWLGAIALLLSPLVAWSQEPPAIVPGSRIRITEIGVGRSELRSGTVVTSGADSVILKLDSSGETMPFPLLWVSRIEVSQGRKGHTAAGVGIGLLAGAGAGALAAALNCNCAGGSDDFTGIAALVGAGVGSVVGMVVGGVIGAVHKTESWEAVPSSRWRVSTGPACPGNLALALSRRF